MRKTFLKRCLLGLLSIPLSCAISHAAVFRSDFNSGLPGGSQVYGAPTGASIRGNGGVGNSGALQLTSNGTGQNGAYYVDNFAGAAVVTNLHVSYRLAIGGGVCCGARPADGMTFAYAAPVAAPLSYLAE